MSAPTRNETFDLADGSYSILDMQDYFEYIFKKKDNPKKINNPSIRIYVNELENWLTFTTKTGYYLELLMPETGKLSGSTKSKITKDKVVKMCLI